VGGDDTQHAMADGHTVEAQQAGDDRATTDGPTLAARARDLANPATVRGTAYLAGGLVLVGLPGLSVAAANYTVGLVLLALGGLDLVHAVSGRGGVERARWRSALRFPVELGLGGVVVWRPELAVTALVALVGLWLVLRGLFGLVRTSLRRNLTHRATRMAISLATTALGVLAVMAAAQFPAAVVLIGGVAAILVGVILTAYGVRFALAPGAGAGAGVDSGSVPQVLGDWVHQMDIGPERRAGLADELYFEPPDRAGKLGAWWAMLLLSGAIATFAILQDSTAVVIGAMLVAPLMVPILGLAGALVNGWPHRAASSAWLVALGAVGVVALSFVLARWVPPLVALDINSQITSRTSPTLVDLLIAVSAGAAGAFATVNLRVASSIAGVAIAVALVPPLAVTGITLAAGSAEESLGSFLLFATNVVAIILSAALVFLLGGFADSSLLRDRAQRLLWTMAPFGALALVVMVPLVFTSQGLIAASNLQTDTEDAVGVWLRPEPGLELDQVEVQPHFLDNEITVRVSGSGDLPRVEDLHEAVSKDSDLPVALTVEYVPSTVTTVDVEGSVRNRIRDR
jgi:uncharacterized hydrophobic protein (TIGR00271 family)